MLRQPMLPDRQPSASSRLVPAHRVVPFDCSALSDLEHTALEMLQCTPLGPGATAAAA